MTQAWQPARDVDFVLRFGGDFGPALKTMMQNAAQSRLAPEDQARELCRILARAVGTATHAYVNAAGAAPLTAVRLPTNADDEGVLLGVRLHLNTPMNNPVDASSGQAVQGLLQALLGLPKGSLARAEALAPEASRAQGPC